MAEIRDATPAQRAALRDLHRRSSYVHERYRAALDAHAEVFGVAAGAIEEGRVRVALTADGGLAGFATIGPVAADGTCVLDDLFVEPTLMRRGIGRALVEDAAVRARAGGARLLTVVTDPANVPFYEGVGFTTTGTAATRFGPALQMRRDLRSRGG